MQSREPGQYTRSVNTLYIASLVVLDLSLHAHDLSSVLSMPDMAYSWEIRLAKTLSTALVNNYNQTTMLV